MKNKFIALALITLSIATTTVSCTTNDDLKDNVKAQNVETAKVDFTVAAENNVTGKMVDQSVVPVYVNTLQIWAKSNVNPAFTVHEMFTFGTGVGAATGFSLDNVALGSNTFQAESWGKDSDKRLSLGSVILPNASANVLDVMKAHTPYIDTFSNQPTVTITKTANAPVGLLMKTYNGRILAKFVQETPNADDYICTVSASVPNGTWDAADGGDTYTNLPETTIASNTGFEWSNSNARFTQSAVFTIKVYANNNGVKGALLNTISKEVAVASATTKLVTFTVKNTDVLTDIQAGGIQLTFPTIGEEVINN